MFFDVNKAEGALGATVPPKAPGGESGQNRNLSQKQFGKSGGGEEAGAEGAGEAVGGAGEAAAGGAAVEELAPLLLLA
jgi:hypothetical protein